MSSEQKKLVSAADFEKKVEIEASHLIYFDRMKKDEAFDRARKEIEKTYISEEK